MAWIYARAVLHAMKRKSACRYAKERYFFSSFDDSTFDIFFFQQNVHDEFPYIILIYYIYQVPERYKIRTVDHSAINRETPMHAHTMLNENYSQTKNDARTKNQSIGRRREDHKSVSYHGGPTRREGSPGGICAIKSPVCGPRSGKESCGMASIICTEGGPFGAS